MQCVPTRKVASCPPSSLPSVTLQTLIVVMVVYVAVCMVTSVGVLWWLLASAERARMRLFSTFMALPRPTVVALASRGIDVGGELCIRCASGLQPQAAPIPEPCHLLLFQGSPTVSRLPELGALCSILLHTLRKSCKHHLPECWPTDAGDDVDDQDTDKWQQEQTPMEGQEGADPAGQEPVSTGPAEHAGKMRFNVRTKANTVSICLPMLFRYKPGALHMALE